MTLHRNVCNSVCRNVYDSVYRDVYNSVFRDVYNSVYRNVCNSVYQSIVSAGLQVRMLYTTELVLPGKRQGWQKEACSLVAFI